MTLTLLCREGHSGPRGPRPLPDERRALPDARTLLCHPVWRGRTVPPGDGLPVLLIPGLLVRDVSLTFLSRWLRRLGYVSYRSKVPRNADLDRLERRVELMVERERRPVALVGQSAGGLLAKGVAIRRPHLVAGVISLGSPHCASEPCAVSPQPFPPDVPFTSIYSRRDGLVDWRACLDPAADWVEVQSSHVGMAMDPAVYRVLGERLAAMGRRAPDAPHASSGGVSPLSRPI